jgi:hypothetical protein
VNTGENRKVTSRKGVNTTALLEATASAGRLPVSPDKIIYRFSVTTGLKLSSGFRCLAVKTDGANWNEQSEVLILV